MIYDRSISTFSENGKNITLIGLTIPLLFEQIFLLLYGTVNTIILSGYSDAAVSATGVAQQITNLAVAILSMVNKGTVIVISVAMGAKNRNRAAGIAGSGMYLVLGISTALAGILYGFARPLMGMMNLSGELQNTAARYLGIVGLLMPVTAMLSYVNNLLICYGYSRITLLSGLISNAINLGLCYIALYSGMEIPVSGVTAVALCGGIAQLIGLGISVYAFFRKKCCFRFGFRWRDAADVLKFGAPAGMSLLSYNLSTAVTTSFVTGLGVAVINTKIYLSSILQYTSRVSVSLGNAGGILIGRHKGANRLDAIKKLFRQNLRLAIACNGILSLAVLALRVPLMSMFTQDMRIIQAAGMIMVMDIAVEVIRAINHIAEYAFNANGEVKTPLITATVSAWCCNVLLSYIFTAQFHWGLAGLWTAMIVDEAFKASVYLLRWRTGKWQKANI